MRTITVVLQIHDQSAADVYWETLKHPLRENMLLNGCTVLSIGTGDVNRHLEIAESLLSDEMHQALYVEISKLNSEELKCQQQAEQEKKTEPPPPS